MQKALSILISITGYADANTVLKENNTHDSAHIYRRQGCYEFLEYKANSITNNRAVLQMVNKTVSWKTDLCV